MPKRWIRNPRKGQHSVGKAKIPLTAEAVKIIRPHTLSVVELQFLHYSAAERISPDTTGFSLVEFQFLHYFNLSNQSGN
jgi:hypothetical protein